MAYIFIFIKKYRATRRVAGSYKPSSCFVKPKTTSPLMTNKTTTSTSIKSGGSPKLSGRVRDTLTESRDTLLSSSNHTITQSSTPGMVLRSADRVSRYNSLRQ